MFGRRVTELSGGIDRANYEWPRKLISGVLADVLDARSEEKP